MLQGFVLWLSLMVAIGPQNALIIKQGLRRSSVLPVLAVVMISDFFLALLGISGVGLLVERAPWLISLLRWVGVVYILWFAWTCFRDARHPESLSAEQPRGRHSPVVAAFVLTWANPSAYIDSIILGSVAAQSPGHTPYLLFGAMCATLLWFPALGLGAHLLSRPLSTPRVWQFINIGIGLMMLAIAARLALSG